MLPITLYIHIPFCLNKCFYCSFFSLNYNKYDYFFYKRYIFSLINDLKNDLYILKNDNRLIKSIYIGGGTPTLLNIDLFELLFENLFLNFKFIHNLEITLETNILNLNKNYFLKLRDMGVNRISIGVQSFDNNILKIINRNYFFKDIINFLKLISNIFDNYNIDLIYGLPNQNINHIINDLKYIKILEIPHISWYELCVDNINSFILKNFKLPKNKILDDMFFLIKNNLLLNNYINYSISCFSLSKSYFCIHNINYWKFGDYIGIGCSSHGKITMIRKFLIYRLIKNNNILEYLNNKFIINKKILFKSDIIKEYFMNIFRLNLPFKIYYFSIYTGLSINLILDKINFLVEEGYLFKKKRYYYITNKGLIFNNDLIENFFN